MKHKRVVAALALAFALGISLSFASLHNDPSASATEIASDATAVTDEDEVTSSDDSAQSPAPQADLVGDVEISDVATFAQAVISKDVTSITLTSDIIIPNTATYVNGVLFYRDLKLAPLEIDLNGHNITSEGNYALHTLYGKYNITGTGTISSKLIAVVVKGSADINFTEYNTLTIGSGVTLSSQYGVLVDQTAGRNSAGQAVAVPYAYGVNFTFNGTINAMQGLYVQGVIKYTDNPVRVNVGDTAVINAEKFAIYAAGYAQWTIGAAHITGETAIGTKAGGFDLTNTTITATGPFVAGNVKDGGMDSTGTVFQVEHHASYADQIEINIDGGTYTSVNGDVFHEYGLPDSSAARATTLTQADININGGTFAAGANRAIFGGDTEEMDIEITAGTFHGIDTPSFSENGYLVGNVHLDANGTVVANTPSRPSRPNHNTGNTTPDGDSNQPEPVLPDQPTTPDDNSTDSSQTAPGTGAILGEGITSAVSTVVPIAVIAGLIVAVYCQRIFDRRRRAHAYAIEQEITAEINAVEADDEPEPIIERFVAVPIDRPEEPTGPVVDPFVPRS